ncbi:FUSC family protein [Actinocorallia longicatena]|uniref:FUSC family protein n=1 Tax=Actinocorallia longicatena TaxID=111803 RepID=A0ABP6Q2B3_9ACTN
MSEQGWLVRAVTPVRAPVPWPAVFRAGISIAAMTAIGLASGNAVAGMIAATGALSGALQNTLRPYRLRLLGIAIPMLVGAVGLIVGEAAYDRGWWTVGVLVGVALVSGLISSIGAVSSGSGLMLLLMAVIGTGIELPGPWWQAPLYHLGGSGFFLGLVLLGWPLHRADPEREAVAGVYFALADVLEAAPEADAARLAVAPAVNAAQDVLTRHRIGEQGRDIEIRRLTTMLNAATPLLEAISLLHDAPAPAGMPAAVRRIGEAVAADHRTCPPAVFVSEEPAFAAAVEYSRRRLAGPRPEDPDLLGRPAAWPVRAVTAVREMVFTWTTWRFALRLALCIGLAGIASAVLTVPRSYWVALTVTFILKPDFGSVFVRALLRGLGTLVGVVIAAAILILVPRGWPAVPLAALFGGLVPLVSARSYAMQTAAVTPLILVLGDLLHHEPATTLATTRLADTALGCVIVLVFGYALWPDSWRVQVSARLADTIDAAAAYLRGAFEDSPARSQRRRGIHRTITTLRTTLQQTLAEPPPASTRAAAWFSAVVAVEQIVDAVTAASVKSRHGFPAPDPADLEVTAGTLSALAAAVRAHEPAPALPDLPKDGLLADLTPEIHTLRAALP